MVRYAAASVVLLSAIGCDNSRMPSPKEASAATSKESQPIYIVCKGMAVTGVGANKDEPPKSVTTTFKLTKEAKTHRKDAQSKDVYTVVRNSENSFKQDLKEETSGSSTVFLTSTVEVSADLIKIVRIEKRTSPRRFAGDYYSVDIDRISGSYKEHIGYKSGKAEYEDFLMTTTDASGTCSAVDKPKL